MMHSTGIQFEYDAEKECLLVKYPDKPMLRPYEIQNQTLNNMTFAEATAFIGEKKSCSCIRPTRKCLRTTCGRRMGWSFRKSHSVSH